MAVAAVAVIGLTASTFVNNEVSRRLATVPVVTTSSTPATTTTVVPRPATPRHRHNKPVPVTSVAAPTTTTTAATIPEEVPQSAYDIIVKLDKLPVRDEHPLGYARYRFGLWADPDGDGCTVEDDVIIFQALQVQRQTDPCRIVSGRWVSPYDNAVVQNPDDVEADHVVALSEAWQSGAYRWNDAQRNAYLNDLKIAGALLAVSELSADDKDGRDPADWLPPHQEFQCRYLQTWVDVKTAWKLAVDAAERESIAAAALSC